MDSANQKDNQNHQQNVLLKFDDWWVICDITSTVNYLLVIHFFSIFSPFLYVSLRGSSGMNWVSPAFASSDKNRDKTNSMSKYAYTGETDRNTDKWTDRQVLIISTNTLVETGDVLQASHYWWSKNWHGRIESISNNSDRPKRCETLISFAWSRVIKPFVLMQEFTLTYCLRLPLGWSTNSFSIRNRRESWKKTTATCRKKKTILVKKYGNWFYFCLTFASI